jgi:hypothetical protein
MPYTFSNNIFDSLKYKLPLGKPKSISSFVNIVSLTLKVIEFYKINFNVAITE